MDRKLLTRILAGILALIMILSLIPIVANAEAMPFAAEISETAATPRGGQSQAKYKNDNVYCRNDFAA